jgi:Na+/phosphate symporter
MFISTFPKAEIDPVTPSKTAGSTTYCFFIVLKLTTELLLSTIYLGAAKALFSVVSDSSKNAASVVFIRFMLFSLKLLIK